MKQTIIDALLEGRKVTFRFGIDDSFSTNGLIDKLGDTEPYIEVKNGSLSTKIINLTQVQTITIS